MKHIGLFEGVGGFSFAATMMGWETIAWCEWNPFGQKVLKYHFPNAKAHGDITKTDFTIYRGHCDILTGGFPCQPYSHAGKRLGKEDERHLWPEMCRAIREIQPEFVVGENVSGLLSWNGGMVFDEVQTDLETAFQKSETAESLNREGYDCVPFVLPAAGIGAPHKRDRIWFIAHRTGKPRPLSVQQWGQNQASDIDTAGQSPDGTTSDTNDTGTNNNSGPDRNRPAKDTGREQPFPEHRTNGRDGNVANTHPQRPQGAGHQEKGAGFKNHNSHSERTFAHPDGSGRVENIGGRKPKHPNKDGETGTFADTHNTSAEHPLQTRGDIPAGGNDQRIFAHPNGSGRRESDKENEGRPPEQFNSSSFPGHVADTNSNGQQGWGETEDRETTERQTFERYAPRFWNPWENFPSQPPVCSGNDGIPAGLVGITVSKHRNESIKAYGNAIVPQVAVQIFKAIEAWQRDHIF